MKYKLARNRSGRFTVNCPITKKVYRFNGSRKGSIDTKEVGEETYLFLLNSTTTFKCGELVLVEKEQAEEMKSQMFDEEKGDIEHNTHTREEIEEILNGNTNTMKAKLKEITLIEEKKFVAQVAKDIKLDSASKQRFLTEWAGVSFED